LKRFQLPTRRDLHWTLHLHVDGVYTEKKFFTLLSSLGITKFLDYAVSFMRSIWSCIFGHFWQAQPRKLDAETCFNFTTMRGCMIATYCINISFSSSFVTARNYPWEMVDPTVSDWELMSPRLKSLAPTLPPSPLTKGDAFPKNVLRRPVRSWGKCDAAYALCSRVWLPPCFFYTGDKDSPGNNYPPVKIP